VKNSTAITDLQ